MIQYNWSEKALLKKNLFDASYFEGKTSNYLGSYQGFLTRIYLGYRLGKILKFLSKGKRRGKLLDIGCAYGFLTNSLNRYGYTAIGIDISEFAIEQARSRFPYLNFTVDVLKKESILTVRALMLSLLLIFLSIASNWMKY